MATSSRRCSPARGNRLRGVNGIADRGVSGQKVCLLVLERLPSKVFSGIGSKIFLQLEETLHSRPGSKLITTRRLTNRWQHETLGVTQLLNGAWSSVPPCRNSAPERGRCVGRRAELHEGCPKTAYLAARSQQADYRSRSRVRHPPLHA